MQIADKMDQERRVADDAPPVVVLSFRQSRLECPSKPAHFGDKIRKSCPTLPEESLI
ncbi:MAG: hypothetical protein ACHQZS_11615 [Candidatus Binatales bacterium]